MVRFKAIRPRPAHVIASQRRGRGGSAEWHAASKGSCMFFSLLPEARHQAVSEYVRDRAAALRRASPGQAPIPVYRPAASRFLLAGLCAWVLWQPVKGFGAPLPHDTTPTTAIEAPCNPASTSGVDGVFR